MSEVLLDFVDNLVNRESEDGPAITTEIANAEGWFSTATNFTDVDDAYDDDLEEEGFCTIPTELFEDFTAEEFSNTRIIRWMHSVPPRRGYSKDVLDLMVGTEAQKQDYVRGLFASATTLLIFFFVWALALLVFKLMAPTSGSNRLRWLAGQPLRMESPPCIDKHYDPRGKETASMMEWKEEYTNAKHLLWTFRIVVWVAGLSITISALVMSVYGIDSLANTLEAGRESIGIVKSLAGKARTIVDSVISQNRDLSQKVFGMLEEVNGMCPLVRDPLCDDIYNTTTCNLTSVLGDDLNNVFKTAAGHFAAGDESEYFQEIVNAANGLKDVELVSQNMDSSAAHLNWVLSLSMVLSLLLAMLNILILCGLICPEVPKVLQMVRSKFMIPVFVCLVFFAYVFCLVFVTASIATADLCVYHDETSNIDERLMVLLNRSQAVEEFLGDDKEVRNLVTEFIGFYIHQCPVEMLPTDIVDQLEYVKAGVPLVRQFGSIVAQSTNLIQGVCGFDTDQTDNLVGVADTLQDQLCGLADIVADVRDFVQCGNWYPLYETTVYEALCYDGTKGFAYVASTQFVIVFMAFVVLTFRVAFWDVRVGDEFFDFVDEDSQESSSYRGEGGDDEEVGRNNNYYHDLRSKLGLRSTLMGSSSSSARSVSSSEQSYSSCSSPPLHFREVPPTGSMEEKMNQLRKSEWEWHRLASNLAATISPTKTASLSSGSSHEEEEQQPVRPARNSIYPSRRFLCKSRSDGVGVGADEEVRGAAVKAPAPIVAVGTTTAYDGGEDGIEVVEDLGRFLHESGGGNNNTGDTSDNKGGEQQANWTANFSNAIRFQTSKSGGGSFNNKTTSFKRSRPVNASSLWLKGHQDNIDYVDSEEENSGDYESGSYGSYSSYGNDWSSRGG